MQTIGGEKSTMVSAAQMLEHVRPFAASMVEDAERQTGSRMVAYEHVASLVGVSPGWLRKMMSRSAEVKEVAAHEYFNFMRAYSAICARVEVAAEREREKRDELRRQADAALASAMGMVEGSPREGRGGAPPQ